MSSNSYFSGTSNSILSEKAIKHLDSFFENVPVGGSTSMLSESSIAKIYNDYIEPNLFAIIIFVGIFIYLFIKYILKHNEKKKNKKVKNDDDTDNDTDNETVIENNNNNIDNIDNDISLTPNEDNEDKFSKDHIQDNSSYVQLNDEYNRAIKANLSSVSEHAMCDIYKRKKDQFAFDELTRVIVEGR